MRTDTLWIGEANYRTGVGLFTTDLVTGIGSLFSYFIPWHLEIDLTGKKLSPSNLPAVVRQLPAVLTEGIKGAEKIRSSSLSFFERNPRGKAFFQLGARSALGSTAILFLFELGIHSFAVNHEKETIKEALVSGAKNLLIGAVSGFIGGALTVATFFKPLNSIHKAFGNYNWTSILNVVAIEYVSMWMHEQIPIPGQDVFWNARDGFAM